MNSNTNGLIQVYEMTAIESRDNTRLKFSGLTGGDFKVKVRNKLVRSN